MTTPCRFGPRHERLRAAATVALIAFLTGCGGSDVEPTPSPDSPPPPTQTSVAVSFQGDAGHAGIANAPTPTFPLLSAWQRTFGNSVSYPLIAEGKVFVVVGSVSNLSAQLVAIDQTTGLDAWPAVSIGSSYGAGHAYDQGRIFVLGSDGVLRSFDAATGTPGWSTRLSFGQSMPVARDGKVYVAVGNVTYAVDGKSGAILWSNTSMYGSGAPSLSASGVLFAAACQAYSLLQSTGIEQWGVHPTAACSEGSVGTVAYAAGRAYSRAYDFTRQRPLLVVRNAETGDVLGSANLFGFSTMPIPAVSADAAYVLNAGTLQRFDPTLQNVSWSFAGDGTLASSPLVIGNVVMIGSNNGRLSALDAATGRERWSSIVPASIDTPSENGFPVSGGMAAANGILVVPSGRTLSTWRLTPS